VCRRQLLLLSLSKSVHLSLNPSCFLAPGSHTVFFPPLILSNLTTSHNLTPKGKLEFKDFIGTGKGANSETPSLNRSRARTRTKPSKRNLKANLVSIASETLRNAAQPEPQSSTQRQNLVSSWGKTDASSRKGNDAPRNTHTTTTRKS
jgi:hypothetical protein